MDRKEYKLQYHRLRDIGAFTLIELLIGIVLSSVTAIVLYDLMTTQSRTYSIQDDIAEMQQNLRVAVERISRDMMMAGFGKPRWSTINGQDASAWYNVANTYTPYRITLSAGNNAIDIVGCVDTIVSQVNADAAVGATAITLSAGQGVNFNITTKQDINIGGAENAKVTAVAGDVLTIDTNPALAGNQGLQLVEPANTMVCLVKWVTYSLGANNGFYVDAHQGQGSQPVAQNITAMTLSISGNLLTIILTGRTRNPDRTTGQYITSQVTDNVFLRN